MKKTLLLLSFAWFTHAMTQAQSNPKWAEQARKASFSVITYDKNNSIKGTGTGFYIENDGSSLTDYTLFEGAEKAIVILTNGKEYPVLEIEGASAIYDLVKFKTATDKKTSSLTIATKPSAVGETVYILPYSTQKTATIQTAKITKVDQVGERGVYYTLDVKTNDKMTSCPVLNAEGKLLGLLQTSNSEKESYAIDATIGSVLSISALSLNDAALSRIGIKKGLPDAEEQASIYLFMAASQLNHDDMMKLLEDYLLKFPQGAEAYVQRAALNMDTNDSTLVPLVNADFQKALAVAKDQSSIHYAIAKLMYNYTLSKGSEKTQPEWNYEQSLKHIRQSVLLDNQPIYKQLEGDLLFALRRYEEAYVCYEFINQSELASPISFHAAAKCKELVEFPDYEQAVVLMNRAIEFFKKPYTSEIAPYFYERATLKMQQNLFREAVVDYDNFFEAIGGKGRVSAEFYFQREQAEIQCRMYKQALDDINEAVAMSPNEVIYWVEKGSVHIRIAQFDEATEALKKAIEINPSAGVAYRMLGYCMVQQKKMKEACTHFAKAKELGDEVVQTLIDKYCK
ncbi:MAG: trypsin-like peptidase domain-containing protein [Phocaeicola sp.]